MFSISSFLLYATGTLFCFFLTPLQILRERRGDRALWIAAAMVALFLGMYTGYSFLFQDGSDLPWGQIKAVLLVPSIALIAGLVIFNMETLKGMRSPLKLLIAAGAAGAITVTAALAAWNTSWFQQGVKGIADDFTRLYQNFFAVADPETLAEYASLRDPAVLLSFAVAAASQLFTYILFVILSFAWYVGGAIAFRMSSPVLRKPRPRLAAFRLESGYLWPLICAGVMVLLGLLLPEAWTVTTICAMVGWNAGLPVWLLFGVQGLGILKFAFEKRRLPPSLWTLAVGLLIALLFSRINLVPVLALPLLGVSENWIRYRIPRDSEEHDFGKE